MPKSSLRAFAVVVVTLLAGLVPAFLLTTTASAAPEHNTTAAAAASHSGLQCRSHKAASTGPAGKILVPLSYCYDPDTTTHPGWHDYCTKSWDTWDHADFRGPCSYHDLCLQAGNGHGACDPVLLSDLKHNCKFAYSSPLKIAERGICYTTAYSYYLVIKVKTLA